MKVQHLAIDRPSHKFTSFLMKHYNLRATIPQVRKSCLFSSVSVTLLRRRPVYPRERLHRNMCDTKPAV